MNETAATADMAHLPASFDMLHAFLTISTLLLLVVTVVCLIRIRSQGFSASSANLQEPAENETALDKEPSVAAPDTAVTLKQTEPESALQLLSLLQQEARFIDFVEEDIAQYSDAEIGAASRIVHEGCRKVLRQNFTIESVHPQQEQSRVTVPEGFDNTRIRLTGNVSGSAPFSGTLIHRGWEVTETRLPKLAAGHQTSILLPAEVEL